MRVTVTQWAGAGDYEAQWKALSDHCRTQRPDMVLLPELPFSSWFPARETVDEARFTAAEEAHRQWVERVDRLPGSMVLYTHPAHRDGVRVNEAVIQSTEYRRPQILHAKTALPDEPGWRERAWFTPGTPLPETHIAIYSHLEVTRLGVMICSELWMEHARRLGMQGARILAVPRATADGNYERWLMAGRMAAIHAGAFCLSANRAGKDEGVDFGGKGWIVSPEGDVLAETSDDEPFITRELDLLETEQARYDYPRTLYMTLDPSRGAFI